MDIRLSDILGALSHALDLTEGQPQGHAKRTCLIAMRIAAHLELHGEDRATLFYGALLKDAGCSSNAARMASLYGGDDREAKRDWRRIDGRQPAQALRHVVRTTGPISSPWRKVGNMRRVIAASADSTRALTELRCERGADVARSVGLDEAVATAIRHLDEHWDGHGHPQGLAGDAISLSARILCLAQTAEVFWQGGGAAAACAVARERRGTWFDPALADALAACEDDRVFWAGLHDPDVTAVEPTDLLIVADADVQDRVAGAFAQIVDAKSPYTARHSVGVAEIAVAIAARLGLSRDDQRGLRRAALLHDIGKLGVSNVILDKRGALDDRERAVMQRHPELTLEILRRVPAFRGLAFVAAAHHERLDGSGYFRGLGAEQLDTPSRILAVADVAEALSADRPYRARLGPDAVLDIMRREAARTLDASALYALEDYLPRWSSAASRTPEAPVHRAA